MVKVTPRIVPLVVASTEPAAPEEAPAIVLAPEAKDLTLPFEVCNSGDWIYLRTPEVVEPESKVQETTVSSVAVYSL